MRYDIGMRTRLLPKFGSLPLKKITSARHLLTQRAGAGGTRQPRQVLPSTGTSRTVSALSVTGSETATNRLKDDWQKFDSCG
jgi:hypothetical protein